MAVRTIFAMAEDCTKGERLGWYEFVRDYGDVCAQLIRRYFPELSVEQHVPAVFGRARAEHNAWFSRLRFSNEREFSMAFRELVYDSGREATPAKAAAISLDQLREMMRELPMVERAMIWLFVKGYTPQQIPPILMNAEATAVATRKLTDERLTQIAPGVSGDPLSASWRTLFEAAAQTKSDKCLSLKTFNNIINGQITWREREIAEEHIRDCSYCLDGFSSFQEMIRLRKDAKPLPEKEVEQILAQLDLPAAKPKGLLGRLFAKG